MTGCGIQCTFAWLAGPGQSTPDTEQLDCQPSDGPASNLTDTNKTTSYLDAAGQIQKEILVNRDADISPSDD